MFFAFFDPLSLAHRKLCFLRKKLSMPKSLNMLPLDICIKGLTFIKKRGDSLSNERSMRVRQVHTLPEIGHIIKEIFLVGY